ncbi:MAG: ASPIC/UnbV domain-containing protein [Planctomycetota bacterium]
MNRDGLVDVYIGQFDQFEEAFNFTGQMDALYLNGGNDGTNFPFWDVTYDRTLFPFFAGQPVHRFPEINWPEYLPVYGYQDELGSFQVPGSKPFARFGATMVVAFSDLNDDLWRDLLVTNVFRSGKLKSVFENGGLPAAWLPQTMICLNRGNDPSGKWLGFRPVNWELFLAQAPGSQALLATGSPMGLDLGDFDANGTQDFYVGDSSLRMGDSTWPTDANGNPDPDPTEVIHFGNLFYINLPGDSLDLASDGPDFLDPDPTPMNSTPVDLVDLQGLGLAVGWWSWGTRFQDFDNDGDLDLYVCSKRGKGSGGHILDALTRFFSTGEGDRAWDRLFLNNLSQDPSRLLDPGPLELFTDMNPAPFDVVVDSNGNPTSTPLWNISFRRFSSRNPFLGDFDHDGYQDLVIVPGTGFFSHRDKTWVLRNATGNVLDNSSIDAALHYDPLAAPGHPNNSFGVGAKVEVQADLDGDGVLDTWDPLGTGIVVPRKQCQEMFLGGGNGATSTSPSLHFGLGQTGKNSFQDNVVIQVTWPCGHFQEKKIAIAGVNTQLPVPIDFDSSLPTAHPLLIQDLTFTTPVVDGLGNYPAGMNPLIVEGDITLNALPPGIDPAKAIRQVEIALRPAGTSGPFLPVATVKADSERPADERRVGPRACSRACPSVPFAGRWPGAKRPRQPFFRRPGAGFRHLRQRLPGRERSGKPPASGKTGSSLRGYELREHESHGRGRNLLGQHGHPDAAGIGSQRNRVSRPRLSRLDRQGRVLTPDQGQQRGRFRLARRADRDLSRGCLPDCSSHLFGHGQGIRDSHRNPGSGQGKDRPRRPVEHREHPAHHREGVPLQAGQGALIVPQQARHDARGGLQEVAAASSASTSK